MAQQIEIISFCHFKIILKLNLITIPKNLYKVIYNKFVVLFINKKTFFIHKFPN